MDSTQITNELTRLGEQLGIGALAFDEQGICSLAIDDGRWIVAIGHSAGENSLRLMLCVDERVPDERQAYRLLAANFAWQDSDGATFALAPDSGALIVQRNVSGDELGAGQLPALLEALVATAERWTAELGSTPALESGAPETNDWQGVRG